MLSMPAHTVLESPTERQLLTQLGERLRRARTVRGVSTVELAKRLGISRTTLRAVESGEPSPTVGTYVRVLGALGLAGDLVLVAAGERTPQDSDTPDPDTVSRALHAEVARMLDARPSLRVKARSLVSRPDVTDSLSKQIARRLHDAVTDGDMKDLLEDSPAGRILRSVSPLPELVPDSKRDAAVARFVRGRRLHEKLRPRVNAALQELEKRGARAEVVGSYAWGGFTEGSDVDFLVLDAGDLTYGDIYDAVAHHLQKVPFDVAYFSRMTPRARQYLTHQLQAHGSRALEAR